MTWLAAKLDKRIDICKPIQTPDSDGGFRTTYEILVSVWAGFEPKKQSSLLNIIRGVNTSDDIATHTFIVRECAVRSLRNSLGQNTINPIKSNYFIFLRQGDEDSLTVGRRFAIKEIIDYGEKGEFYKIDAQEMFEEGASY